MEHHWHQLKCVSTITQEAGHRPTLPPPYEGSTIGPGELNGRIRNGNGCGLSSMITPKKEDS